MLMGLVLGIPYYSDSFLQVGTSDVIDLKSEYNVGRAFVKIVFCPSGENTVTFAYRNDVFHSRFTCYSAYQVSEYDSPLETH